MRKRITIQIGIIFSVLFIGFYAWSGYNYLTVMNWLLNQNNLLALCFGIIALYTLVIIGYQVKLNQIKNSKEYYYNQMEKYRDKFYNRKDVTTQIKELKELINNGKRSKRS